MKAVQSFMSSNRVPYSQRISEGSHSISREKERDRERRKEGKYGDEYATKDITKRKEYPVLTYYGIILQ